jgi:hypothetical protein
MCRHLAQLFCTLSVPAFARSVMNKVGAANVSASGVGEARQSSADSPMAVDTGMTNGIPADVSWHCSPSTRNTGPQHSTHPNCNGPASDESRNDGAVKRREVQMTPGGNFAYPFVERSGSRMSSGQFAGPPVAAGGAL